MKLFFSILCLLCLMEPLSATDHFMGESIYPDSNTSSDDVFNAMLMTWTQDIQHARKNGDLSLCSQEEIAAARQAVNEAVFAARHPKLQPREDAFTAALTARFATAPTMRSDMAELQAFLNRQHQSKVDFVTSLLAGDRPATEFLTNTRLEDAPENYADTCQAKFRTACAAWQQYIDAAARLHCPIPSRQGSSTPAATDSCRQMLQCQFEDFLTLLAGGLGK